MSTSAKMPAETRLAGGSSTGLKYNHSQVRPDHSYNGIEHYKLTNNVTVKNRKDLIQPVKPHSTTSNEGQQFVNEQLLRFNATSCAQHPLCPLTLTPWLPALLLLSSRWEVS